MISTISNIKIVVKPEAPPAEGGHGERGKRGMRALVKRAVVMLSLSASWSKGALAATPSSSDGVIGSNAPSNTASRSSGASSSSGEVQSTIDAASVNRPAPGKSKGEDAVNVHADCHFAYAALGDGVGVLVATTSLVALRCVALTSTHAIELTKLRAIVFVYFV